mgnify:CR=1 FL=1
MARVFDPGFGPNAPVEEGGCPPSAGRGPVDEVNQAGAAMRILPARPAPKTSDRTARRQWRRRRSRRYSRA